MRYQPQGLIRRNPESRIAKAAQALLLANSQFNIASGVPLRSAGTVNRTVTPAGINLAFRKNGYIETEVLPAIGTQTFVEFWYGYPTANGGAAGNPNEPAFVTGSSNNSTGITTVLGSAKGGATPTSWGAVYNWATMNSAGEALTPNVLTMLVVFRNQTGMEFWRDGRLISTVTQAPVSYGASAFITGSFVEDTGFWPSSSDTIIAGRIVIEATADEIRQFSRSPWPLFQAPDEDDFVVAASGNSYSYTAAGGFVLSGVATKTRGSLRSASGGMQLSGAAPVARKANRTTSGGIQLSGAATATRRRSVAASGGLALSGAATFTRKAMRAAVGGFQMAGAAAVSFSSAVQSRVVNPIGGMLLAGAAAIRRSIRKVASGGITFAGSASVAATGTDLHPAPFNASTVMRFAPLCASVPASETSIAATGGMADKLNASTIMNANPINAHATMSNAALNLTANLL